MHNNSRLPLYIQAKNFILEKIASGEYGENSQLPTEKQFMELLNIGRATVRAALAELENESYIYKRHGIGTFVSPPKSSTGFEPFISLSYMLERLGFDITNDVLLKEETLPEGILLEKWAPDEKIGALTRLRRAQGKPVAIENSYFVEDLFKKVESIDSDKSIAHEVLTSPEANIEKVDLSLSIRTPTEEECGLLELKKGEKVIELTRWIFREKDKHPLNFVKFVIAEAFIQYPIKVLDQR